MSAYNVYHNNREDCRETYARMVTRSRCSGYNTERAISEIIDNSIGPGQCTEIFLNILTTKENDPYKLYIVDNGMGIENIRNTEFISKKNPKLFRIGKNRSDDHRFK